MGYASALLLRDIVVARNASAAPRKLRKWFTQSIGAGSNYLTCIAANKKALVAVGYPQFGSGGVYSRDADRWIFRANPQNVLLNTVGALPSGRFIAGGDPVGANRYVIVSDDNGKTWAQRLVGDATGGMLSSAHDGTVFCFGCANVMFTSPDGDAWTQIAHGMGGFVVGLCSVGARLVAVNSQGNIFTSDNHAVTWTQRLAPVFVSFNECAANSAGVVVAVGNTLAGQALLYTSLDAGLTWAPKANPRNLALISVGAFPSGKFLVSGAQRPDNLPYTLLGDRTGSNWTEIAVPVVGSFAKKLLHVGGRLWAAGNPGVAGALMTNTRDLF